MEIFLAFVARDGAFPLSVEDDAAAVDDPFPFRKLLPPLDDAVAAAFDSVLLEVALPFSPPDQSRDNWTQPPPSRCR